MNFKNFLCWYHLSKTTLRWKFLSKFDKICTVKTFAVKIIALRKSFFKVMFSNISVCQTPSELVSYKKEKENVLRKNTKELRGSCSQLLYLQDVLKILNKSQQNVLEGAETSVKNNLRKNKSLTTNNQKCKKKQVQTNKRTLIF